MRPRESYIPVPGGRIFALEWGEGPLLLFTHATGMCARVYSELLEPLADRFHIIAYDARGHGRTELEAIPGQIPTDWVLYRQDLRNLIEALGGGPVRLAGHSFGASVSLETAADNPGLATSLCLIDPPFIPFAQAEAYRTARDAGTAMPNHMADQAERRRSHFASREAARTAYHNRGVFTGWPDRALDDYIEGGLLPDETGVRLACTPAWEATSFRGVTSSFQSSVTTVNVPLSLLAASHGSTVPAHEEDWIRAHVRNAMVQRVPNTGHFLPVTHPDLIRPHLAALV
ncbi:alpha/beta hydrolase [Sandaracinobacter neustonicus]|uniref:Alpha/beta hydrolase n=1 Tax=Sandaracinobacter neustonicus TaxID=1715348 RepID=A0A501XDH1_9SPHN|nr:alpha/beta hydrolase [Sandaracinobacter neustonicus]TPE58536.1 alpha/beta hydrolase [Sandaracinobacter neustonicus]